MTVDELIEKLQALPVDLHACEVVTTDDTHGKVYELAPELAIVETGERYIVSADTPENEIYYTGLDAGHRPNQKLVVIF